VVDSFVGSSTSRVFTKAMMNRTPSMKSGTAACASIHEIRVRA